MVGSNSLFRFLTLAAATSFGWWGQAGQATTHLNIPVQVRPTVTATIHAQVMTNPSHPTGGRTLLIQHGMAHSGNTAKPLAEKIFTDPVTKYKISKIVLPDLPGRGGSTLPSGMLFGDLNMIDYGNVLLGVLDGLEAEGIYVDSLIGHSMGGMIIELAQNKLISQGSHLFHRYGIDTVALLAAAAPREVAWFTADGPLGTVVLLPNIRWTVGLGTHVSILDLVWQNLFFTNNLLLYAPGTPSLATIASEGYNAKEAYIAAAETVGYIGHQRPSVQANIFSSSYGTITRVAAHNQDRNVTVAEQRNLYRYLTGDVSDTRFTEIPGIYAVHDMLMSDPQGLIDAGLLADF